MGFANRESREMGKGSPAGLVAMEYCATSASRSRASSMRSTPDVSASQTVPASTSMTAQALCPRNAPMWTGIPRVGEQDSHAGSITGDGHRSDLIGPVATHARDRHDDRKGCRTLGETLDELRAVR